MSNTDGSFDANDYIDIEFPTELIPDEYEHENGTNGLVYILQDDGNQNLADKLLHSLEQCGYNVPSENIFSVNDSNAVMKQLTDLATYEFTEKTCLLVVLIANTSIFKGLRPKASKIWSPFIENSTLKYKPKIFMFYEYEEIDTIATDSMKSLAKEEPYDVPSEADVLIVYQKSTVHKKKKHVFLEEFSEVLKKYGERDDIMGLLVRTQSEPRPLIISTLRKKFYITSSTSRDHYFDIQSNSEKVLNMINLLNRRMQNIGRDLPKRTTFVNRVTVDKGSNKPTQSTQKLKKNLTVPDSLSNRRISDGSSTFSTNTKGSKPERPRWRN